MPQQFVKMLNKLQIYGMDDEMNCAFTSNFKLTDYSENGKAFFLPL